jgi:Mg-chelatase subunit ChlD
MNLPELLESVRRVEVRTNRLVNDTMVGAYLSRFRGRGMDFEELREYMPGDDVRDIDWNVSNRMGRPFVKRFREERELGLVLALDVSASSTFGSGDLTKREFATEVAATLAHSAARSSDKVALLLFSDQVELFVPPRKGRRHLLRLFREMLSHQPKHRGTNIPAALTFLNRVLHRRSMVFLLTDFLHSTTITPALFHRMGEGETVAALGRISSSSVVPDAETTSPSPVGQERAGVRAIRDVFQEVGLTNSRHDLVCVHLHDPLESTLPSAGLVTIEDAETGDRFQSRFSSSAVHRDKQRAARGTRRCFVARWRRYAATQYTRTVCTIATALLRAASGKEARLNAKSSNIQHSFDIQRRSGKDSAEPTAT